MRIEDKVREHLEVKASRYPTSDIDLADVIKRGDRLRKRARGATLVMSVAAIAAVAVVGVAMVGSGRADPDAATLLLEQSLFDQVLEAWTPVPDTVDPELAASAVDLCTPPPGDIPDLAGIPEGLPLLLIDQRGIIADAYFGGEVREGAFLSYNCPLIKIDGVWQSSLSVTEAIPQMRGASGGPLEAGVAEVRIRFADDNEVVASIGNSYYYVQYPMSLDNAGSYIALYRSDGSLISSGPYFLPSKELSEDSTQASLVGLPLPEFDLVDLRTDDVVTLTSDTAETTVVVVWAPWCSFCANQLLAAQAVADDASPGVRIIGVATQAESSESSAMLDDLGITFPNGFDEGNAAHEALGIEILPITFVADHNGIVVAQLVGETTTDELRQAIEATQQ